jgi:uncharacterized protein YndB with AHSA1/START domain
MNNAMTDTTRPASVGAPVQISRHFNAPRQLVFQAWSTAAHIKAWFSPAGFTVPDAEIDFRPGGAFNVCMRSPQGECSWVRGSFVEVAPPDRLVIQGAVEFDGRARFTARTTVIFTEEAGGTRLSVTQAYEILDPNFMGALTGAPQGWRETLDKLQQHLVGGAALRDRL